MFGLIPTDHCDVCGRRERVKNLTEHVTWDGSKPLLCRGCVLHEARRKARKMVEDMQRNAAAAQQGIQGLRSHFTITDEAQVLQNIPSPDDLDREVDAATASIMESYKNTGGAHARP